ncbi:hypothetical protein PAPYR_6453 [Paratrimastix pyriformis]|uniref:Uncharacterized protein n=1 Tax=Paratrimastix pyriformis TaxID=342808 RepID=A0ABQ8UF65_9EUKA|nr:hypothetical protein PAPYR_6453 [Paratrimastix pyriformis]
MLHIGTASTLGNSFPTSFQCGDPIMGMRTYESFDPDCAPLSDLSPCRPAAARTRELFRGGPRHDLNPAHLVLPALLPPATFSHWAASPHIRGPTPGTVRVPRTHVGASGRGESCAAYCRRVHYPTSACRPDLLQAVNSCTDLGRFLGCRGCQGLAGPVETLPGRMRSGVCAFMLVPRYLACDTAHDETERLCACAIEETLMTEGSA